MFSMWWTAPHQGEIKILRFKKSRDPVWHGLGVHVDIDGNAWDVKMIQTTKEGRFICARPYDTMDPYNSTAMGGYGFSQTQYNDLVRTWIPYRVELIDD